VQPLLIEWPSEMSAEAVEHGEVFTRRWIVDLILDLAGYTANRDLASAVAVEPACGVGAFLEPMILRLSASCRERGHPLRRAVGAIQAFDLLAHNVSVSRRLAERLLVDDGWPAVDAAWVAESWIHQGDYLLFGDRRPDNVDFVLGNPPYIRLEDVPGDRMAAYRRACPTMNGRSDIYVGFYEVGLRSLKPEGVLAFICADRWMRNQYGQHLRQLITGRYSIDVIVTMHEVDAFEEQVSAYPAISVVRRGLQGPAVVAEAKRSFTPGDARALLTLARQEGAAHVRNDRFEIARLSHWFSGHDSWPSGTPARIAVIEHLNERFSPLEDPATGTRVGIGVATGADSVFITTEADVEREHLLPVSMVRDISSGVLSWSGHYLVNPWDESGRLADLRSRPRLRAYFGAHADVLRQRHIASKRETQWYRTIDRVDPLLTGRPKLLIPDMKLVIHPVLDEGGYYPHHNIYYVVSDIWNLRVLGGLLLSRVAQAFVEAYAVRMRGGTLRFQAQYLRRIRVPAADTISKRDRAALSDAFAKRDTKAATEAAIRVYGIDDPTGEFA
jgi:adenine-specific DNA-methyltransferase